MFHTFVPEVNAMSRYKSTNFQCLLQFLWINTYEIYSLSVVAVFWDVTPCSVVESYRRFRGGYWLHRQGRKGKPTTEKFYQTTRRHNPIDSIVQSLRLLVGLLDGESVQLNSCTHTGQHEHRKCILPRAVQNLVPP
jgi:hypothetical protein